jgi:hypothetical protein
MSATTLNGRTPRAPRIESVPEPREPGLADALLAFAAEAPKLLKNADGQIHNRTYKYVTLDALLDDVAPLLVKHELVFTAKPAIAQDGSPAALYRMTHVPSGEIDEWTGPLPCVEPGPQNLGSTITYMRRYTLVAYLNLAPGDDDDGKAASEQSPRAPVDRYAEAAEAHAQLPPAPPSTAAVPQPVAATPKPSGRPATAKQKTMIEARARAADLTAQEMANVLKVARGEETVIWQDGAAAKRWADRELQRLPATLVDAVLAGIKAKS